MLSGLACSSGPLVLVIALRIHLLIQFHLPLQGSSLCVRVRFIALAFRIEFHLLGSEPGLFMESLKKKKNCLGLTVFLASHILPYGLSYCFRFSSADLEFHLLHQGSILCIRVRFTASGFWLEFGLLRSGSWGLHRTECPCLFELRVLFLVFPTTCFDR